MEFEIKIIEFLQSGRTPLYDVIFQLISALGSIAGVIALVVFFLFYKRKLCFWYLFTYGLVYLTVNVLKVCISRVRPFNASDTIANIGDSVSDYSFPSGHVACATAISIFLCCFLTERVRAKSMKVWIVLFGIVFVGLVCISRMYLGKHYLSDVLAGGVISAIISFAAIILMKTVDKKRRKKE